MFCFVSFLRAEGYAGYILRQSNTIQYELRSIDAPVPPQQRKPQFIILSAHTVPLWNESHVPPYAYDAGISVPAKLSSPFLGISFGHYPIHGQCATEHVHLREKKNVCACVLHCAMLDSGHWVVRVLVILSKQFGSTAKKRGLLNVRIRVDFLSSFSLSLSHFSFLFLAPIFSFFSSHSRSPFGLNCIGWVLIAFQWNLHIIINDQSIIGCDLYTMRMRWVCGTHTMPNMQQFSQREASHPSIQQSALSLSFHRLTLVHIRINYCMICRQPLHTACVRIKFLALRYYSKCVDDDRCCDVMCMLALRVKRK